MEGVTGRDVGQEKVLESAADEVADLYNKLEQTILLIFYDHCDSYAQIMRSTMLLSPA